MSVWLLARHILVYTLSVSVVIATTPIPSRAQSGSASDTPACSLTGSWQSTFGPLTFKEHPVDSSTGVIASSPVEDGDGGPEIGIDITDDALAFSATYETPDGVGRIDGIRSGLTLNARWYRPPTFKDGDAGGLVLTLDAGCTSLAGQTTTQGGDAQAEWSAERVQVAEIESPDLAQTMELDAGSLTGVRDQLQALVSGADVSRFDVAALATRLSGVEETYNHVRDGYGKAVYDGVLRGARGVLLTGAGNAVDRALLLSNLLRAQGIETQFARAQLSDEQALAVVAASSFALPAASDAAPAGIENFAAQPDGDATWLAGQEFQADTARVVDAIIDASPADLPAWQAGARLDAAKQAAAQHVWVRASVDGEWVDLDPTYPGLAAGETIVEAETVSDALPEQAYHSLEINVRIEQLKEGAISGSAVAVWVLKLADIMGAGAPTLALTLQPVDTPQDPGAALPLATSGQAAAGRLDALANSSTVFQPILTLSTGETEVGRPFDLNGNVLPPDALSRLTMPLAGATGEAFGIATDALGGLFGTPAAPEPPDEGALTGVWLEIHQVRPDGTRRVNARALVDRIGPELRAAGGGAVPELTPAGSDVVSKLLSLHRIQALSGPLSPEFIALQAARQALARISSVLGVAARPTASGTVNAAEFTGNTGAAFELVGLAQAMYQAVAELSAATGVIPYQTGAAVIADHLAFSLQSDSDGRMVYTVDVMTTGVSGFTPQAESGDAISRFLTSVGVYLTGLEARMDPPMPRGVCFNCPPPSKTGSFAATLAQMDDDGAMIWLTGDAALPDELSGELSASERLSVAGLRTERDMITFSGGAAEHGAVVWTIDRETGVPVGRDLGGYGSTQSEYAIILAKTIAYMLPLFAGFFGGLASCYKFGSSDLPSGSCLLCAALVGLAFELAFVAWWIAPAAGATFAVGSAEGFYAMLFGWSSGSGFGVASGGLAVCAYAGQQ